MSNILNIFMNLDILIVKNFFKLYFFNEIHSLYVPNERFKQL